MAIAIDKILIFEIFSFKISHAIKAINITEVCPIMLAIGDFNV